jgi:hypothetical protein
VIGPTADTSTIVRVRYKGAVRDIRVRCEECPALACFEPIQIYPRTGGQVFCCGTRAQHGCPRIPVRKLRPSFELDDRGVWARYRAKPVSRMIA